MKTGNQAAVRPAVRLVRVALFAALTGVLSQLAIPLPGLVPLSLATFAVYLAVMVLDWKEAAASMAVYLLLGAVGIPVFSGFGSLGRLIGPTGGYLIGYLACALTAGLILARTGRRVIPCAAALVLGTVVLYAIGTVWYMVQTGSALGPALAGCVLPFLPGDCLKIALAVPVGGRLRAAAAKLGR